jgi:hypothetical protein
MLYLDLGHRRPEIRPTASESTGKTHANSGEWAITDETTPTFSDLP